MNILLISKRIGCSTCVAVGKRGLVAFVLFAFVLLPSLALYGGYQLGNQEDAPALPTIWQGELEQQREAIANAKRTAEENLNALALRLGQMQARIARLDALGDRLTRMAGLEDGEFDFSSPPAQGGPESFPLQDSLELTDFVSQLDLLSQQLEDRNQQLGVLETMLMNRNLQAEVLPSGRPAKSGWISSHFGQRTDPFNGKLVFHKGIDIAGKEGTEVIAVAAGVVTWSGKRSGYGNLVEVTHGNGYATRYGHNKENLVKLGDTVKKGQLIATMGSTGRSTGPHVHFEVLYEGKAVDPMKYVQAAR